ncbi:MAG: hypothetical protein RSD95_10205 [Clostridia bacterium]
MTIQPFLMLTSPVPGLLTVNGRPAGELSFAEPIALPVAPRGAVSLAHQPLVDGFLPLARRITLAGGCVLPASVPDAPGLAAVLWPGGVTEIELTPEPIGGRVLPGSPAQLPGAQRTEDGAVRTFELLNDTVGHAQLSIWREQDGAWTCVHREILWAQGAPAWPDTPDKTAMAALEAALLGLNDEAAGYLTGSVKAQDALWQAARDAKGCVPMKFGALGRSAVGVVRVLGAQLARVDALYYRAIATGGAQGTWRLDDISMESSPAY